MKKTKTKTEKIPAYEKVKSSTNIETVCKANGKKYETRYTILVRPKKLLPKQFEELCEFLEHQGWDFRHINNN